MAGHGFLNKESHQIFQRASLIRNVALKQDTVLFLIKSNRRNGGRPRRTHAPVTKNIYTGKNQDPKLVPPAPEMYVFSKLYFEQSARYINSHLERQSDRDIPICEILENHGGV